MKSVGRTMEGGPRPRVGAHFSAILSNSSPRDPLLRQLWEIYAAPVSHFSANTVIHRAIECHAGTE
jgi:hypothetical protein